LVAYAAFSCEKFVNMQIGLPFIHRS
jgi:hypothetical protein